MTRHFSLMISWGCLALLVVVPVAAFYFLIDIHAFAALAKRALGLPIQWQSVTDLQWYGLWFLMAAYLAIGLGGLYYLRRAFRNFANGELFNHHNSRDLRLFSIFLFAQGVVTPLHMALVSVLLSLNHPSGQKILSISLGSGEIKVIGLAMILWVMSDLLVHGAKIENENKQFI
jgi:phosphoglycerol transferase MdoB-like AlkP superfamily enzyme